MVPRFAAPALDAPSMRAMSRRLRRLRSRVFRILLEAGDGEEGPRRALEAVVDCTSTRQATIWALDDGRRLLRTGVSWTAPDPTADAPTANPPPPPASRRQALEELGWITVAAVPVMGRRSAVGMLELLGDRPDPRPAMLTAALLDIAGQVGLVLERRHRVIELESEIATLLAVVEHTREPVITVIEGDRVGSCTLAAAGLFGYLPADVIGQPVTMLIADPARRTFVEELRASTTQANSSGRPWQTAGVRRDGTSFALEWRAGEVVTGRPAIVATVRSPGAAPAPAGRSGSGCTAADDEGEDPPESSPPDTRRGDATMLWEGLVREALERGRLGVALQPLVRAGTGSVDGYQVRVRPHGSTPNRPLGEFFVAARRIGHGDELDRLCRSSAIDATRPVRPGVRLYLPVTGATFADPAGDARRLLQALKAGGRSPDDVVIELPPILADGLHQLTVVSETYRGHGLAICCTDDGDLTRLEALIAAVRPHRVRLARSLTWVFSSGDAAQRIRSAVNVIHAAGAAAIAEWVENLGDVEGLAGLGVDLVQGFAIGHPVEVGEILAPAAEAMQSLRVDRHALEGRTVLIADHDEATRTLFALGLHDQGVRIVEATDGTQAWDWFQHHPPALLICEWQVSNIDSPGLCRRIRSRPEFDAVPILIYTLEPAEAVLGTLSGVPNAWYLPKTTSWPEVVGGVVALLTGRDRDRSAAGLTPVDPGLPAADP